MARFLVLGASGMAGHVISLYLKERGHEVTGFSMFPVDYLDCVIGNALDEEPLKSLIAEGHYDVVINAIGILNQSAEDHKAEAIYLNSYLPHRLALQTADLPTRIFHMSTDCVFAGNGGPYSETSLPDGASWYDRTKALGELCDDKNLTLRNSIVGPDVNQNGIGLLNWFMKQRGEVNGYTHAMWTGVSTLELAHAMEACALDGATGLVNMVPEGNISKYDLLCLFNHYLRNDALTIHPSDSLVLDKTLVRTNFDVKYRPVSYEQQIKDLASWVSDHPSLYPHYMWEA